MPHPVDLYNFVYTARHIVFASAMYAIAIMSVHARPFMCRCISKRLKISSHFLRLTFLYFSIKPKIWRITADFFKKNCALVCEMLPLLSLFI